MSAIPKEVLEARQAMINKRFGGNANGAATGGAGTARRKNKVAHKTVNDDKKVGSVMKKLNMSEIKGIEEVNFFHQDGQVTNIKAPKITAAVACNTFCITGRSTVAKIEELLPGILTQLGPESMEYLRSYAQSMGIPTGEEAAAAAAEDEEVPELVENFEEVAQTD